MDMQADDPQIVSRPRPLWRRVLRIATIVLGSLLLFVVVAVVVVVTNLDRTFVRTFVAHRVNALLMPTFRGRIQIDSIGALGLLGLSGANVTIFDPTGAPVLVARGVRVRVSTWAAARSALFDRKGPLSIRLTSVSVDDLDVRLDADPQGGLELADAFAPTTPSAPANPKDRGLRFDVSTIALKHAWAHGTMSGAPPLDVVVDDLEGAFLLTPDALEGDVAKAAITARHIAQGQDVAGALVAHVKRASAPPSAMSGRVQWQGLAGGIAHSLRATLDDSKVDAFVDAPHVDPADLRSMWAASTIDQVAAVHAEAHGVLPAVDLVLHASLGPGTFDLTAHALVGDDKSAQVRFESRNIDVHQFAASAPPSRLAITGDVVADQQADGALDGKATVRLLPGSIGAYGFPPASLAARAARTSSGAWSGSVTLTTGEPTLPTRLFASLTPRGSSSQIAFDLHSDAPDLDAVPELRHTVQGRVHLEALGTVDTGAMAVDAHVKARADHVVQGETRADALSVDVDARGAIANPRVHVAVRSQELRVGGRLLSRADVTVAGVLMSPHVVATLRGPELPDVDASGDVSLRGGFSVGKVRLAAVHAGERAQVTAELVKVGGGGLTVDRLLVEGVGSPMAGTVSMAGGDLHVRASTSGIDLARMGRLARLEKTLKGGTLSLDVNLDIRTSAARGHATLDLTDGALGSVGKIATHVDMTMAGRSVTGKVHAEGGGIGTIDLDASKLEVAGRGPLLSASWRQMWGRIGIDGHGDLGKAIALLPPDTVPLDEARGQVAFEGHVARAALYDTHPEVDLTLSTENLVLSPKTKVSHDIDGILVMARTPWRLEGIDFDAHTTINGQSGRIELDLRAKDRKGELLRLHTASNQFPYRDVFGDVARLPVDLQSTPIELEVTMPERGLGSLPDLLKQNYFTGRLAFEAKLRGTVRAPKLDVLATLKRSHFENNSHNEFIDFDVAAHYDGSRGTASLKGKIAGDEVITFDAQADAAVAQFLDSSADARWKASAKGHFKGFPLEAIPAVDEKLISGDLSGDFTLANLHEDARANAKLTLSALKMGTYTYKAAQIDLVADGRSLDGRVHVDQTDGFAEVKGHATAAWGAALAPVLAANKPFDLTLAAKNFRIAALSSVVEGSFDEFDGRIDADTHVELDPQTRGAKVSGSVTLSQGLFEAVAGGGEFRDVSAKMHLTPGTFTLEKLSASGLTGHLEATASARFDNMQLQSATGVVVIPPNSPVPVSAGGAEIGNIDGRFEINAKGLDAGRAMAVTVTVPHVRVALPSGSTNSAISLGPMDRIRIGAHRGHPATFVLVPMDPSETDEEQAPQPGTKITVDTDLQDAEVVRGTDLKVDLGGKIHIAGGSPVEVTGRINLMKGGTLSLQGKTFTVESGTVTMVGPDPSNPQVVVKAGWVAPDGTTVFANFTGPLKTGKVTLTSEPSLSQEEIVQLLMFGTSDGQQTRNPDPELSAVGTVGGQAAQPLNHMLNQMGLGAVSVKVDTNQSATPKPEVEVQIARDISVELAVVLGTPPPGVNPDTSLITVDWRFLEKWSLAATLGDAGTTIFDVLWHQRY